MTAALFTKQERKMLSRAFQRCAKAMAAQLDEARVTHPEHRKVLVAQNVLRGCMESMLNECLPYGQLFLLELGSRLAAYCITAAPHDDAKALTELMVANLHRYVETKLAQGAVIRTEWETDQPASDAPPPSGVH